MGKYDKLIQDYMKKLYLSGGIINNKIVISAAKGILLASDRTLLSTYKGSIKLNKSWAKSVINHNVLLKRKGTKALIITR